ncbi:TPA: hypothetical protein ACGOK3_001798, partial [Streptococcus pyogenes]
VICTIRLVRHLIFKKIDVMFFLYYHFYSVLFYLALLLCSVAKTITEGWGFYFYRFFNPVPVLTDLKNLSSVRLNHIR